VISECVVNSAVLSERFELDVVQLAFARNLDELGRLSMRKAQAFLDVMFQLATALGRRPDAVYSTFSLGGVAFYRDWLLTSVVKYSRVPRIVHLHVRASRASLKSPIKRALCRWALADAQVIHLSNELARQLKQVVEPKHVYCVPNGVARSNARRQNSPGRRMLFLSNLTQEKGVLVLLQAFRILRERNVEFTATLAGPASQDVLAEVMNRIETFGLARRVSYAGPAYGAAKDALLETHDAFVFPTLNDAFPLVVLEAMQAGLPVISSQEGAIPEIVIDGVTGFVVPVGDAAALADRIELLLDKPELVRSFGDAGRNRFLENYTVEKFETRLRSVFEQCLEHESTPRLTSNAFR
jgi:glycosyltransferase involved in cell wall biosynthesis